MITLSKKAIKRATRLAEIEARRVWFQQLRPIECPAKYDMLIKGDEVHNGHVRRLDEATHTALYDSQSLDLMTSEELRNCTSANSA